VLLISISLFPPVKVPAVTVKVPEVVIVILVFCVTIPVYPEFKAILVILAFTSILQFPVPPPSKITASVNPGTELPPAPPEAVDQLETLFQLEAVAATQ
jgi:hypothetical protein